MFWSKFQNLIDIRSQKVSEPGFNRRELSNKPKTHPKKLKNEGDMVISKWTMSKKKIRAMNLIFDQFNQPISKSQNK